MSAGRAERTAWMVGGAGLAGSALGWILVPAAFPHAWLAALTCWIGWPLGCLALILIHALTGGRWGYAIRRQLMAGAATLPLLPAAAVPLLFVLHGLYPWMHPAFAAQLDNRFYLNAPFFYLRGALYLVVWLGLEQWVRRVLRRPDADLILPRIAPPGLILLALTVTFSAIDFTLSMDPHFKSSVYGILVGCEAVLFALSIAVAGAAFAPAQSGVPGVGGSGAGRDLGRLLFGLLMLWAYLDFMQLLIVWNSDLPEESSWYVRRLAGEWSIVAVLVAIFHFFLPFAALMWPQTQRSRVATGAAATVLALAEVPRAWWIVIPAAGRTLSLLDAAAMTALLGAATALALRAYRQTSLQPRAAEPAVGLSSHA